MKKLIGAFVLMTGIFPAWTSGQVRLGISGGLNLAKLKYVPGNQWAGTPDESSLAGYRIGGILDVALKSPFSVQAGAFLSKKGGKNQFSSSLGSYTQKLAPLYLEVPADILVKPYITRGMRLYAGVGPYIGFAMGGKSKVSGSNLPGDPYISNHRLNFGNGSSDDMKKRDIGGNVMAGFEFSNGFLIGVQYSLSFTNNAPSGNNDAPETLRNKVFGVSLGYLFTSYRKWPSRHNYYYHYN